MNNKIIICSVLLFLIQTTVSSISSYGSNASNLYTTLSNADASQACPTLTNADSLSQTQFINALIAPCHYDRLETPPSVDGNATAVYARVYIYVLQNLDTSDLQFKMHGLLQLRYTDSRLAFDKYSSQRTQPILGEAGLRDLIWVPHLFLANEHDSSVLGTNEKDILTSISPNGTVIVSSRIQATLYCWMKLQKFPFDVQYCPIVLESWMYNSSELMLHWEPNTPVAVDPKMHLTEYALEQIYSNETIIDANLRNMRHGAFAGNYSALNFTVHLSREVGYYVMDYFLPSIMIVVISWVSFWLQADQTPARTTLGCTTMLSFITLASSQENNLPKVSYIKISEVWFLACTFFIFGSLVEFAFVNTIWRRKNKIEVKKVKSKYILKSTLTPNMRRHKMSDTSIPSTPSQKVSTQSSFSNFLTVSSSPPITITVDDENVRKRYVSTESMTASTVSLNDSNATNDEKPSENQSWSTMTPQEVSLWIDRKARFLFPLLFLMFNACFWTVVYCM